MPASELAAAHVDELLERLTEYVLDAEDMAYGAHSLQFDPPGGWRDRLQAECPEWHALLVRGRRTLEKCGVILDQPDKPQPIVLTVAQENLATLVRQHGPCSIGRLVEASGLPKTSVNAQLYNLRRLGVVESTREGKCNLWAAADGSAG